MGKSKKPRGSKPKGSHEVGYGKPPKEYQFMKGQSGNPKGRPKGTRNFQTDVRSTLDEKVPIKKDGKPRHVSTQEAALLRLREKALNGDARALDRLLALAQQYNSEEQVTNTHLTTDDQAILDVFKERILSGAADSSGNDQEDTATETDAPPMPPSADNDEQDDGAQK